MLEYTSPKGGKLCITEGNLRIERRIIIPSSKRANFRAKCSVIVFALFEDANGLAVFKSAGSVRYARSTYGYAEFAPFGDTC